MTDIISHVMDALGTSCTPAARIAVRATLEYLIEQSWGRCTDAVNRARIGDDATDEQRQAYHDCAHYGELARAYEKALEEVERLK